MRQHNEPAGNQDVWHFHVHVLPCHGGDELYRNVDRAIWIAAEQRAALAAKLRAHLGEAARRIGDSPGDSP